MQILTYILFRFKPKICNRGREGWGVVIPLAHSRATHFSCTSLHVSRAYFCPNHASRKAFYRPTSLTACVTPESHKQENYCK